jgi:hypothetical protein
VGKGGEALRNKKLIPSGSCQERRSLRDSRIFPELCPTEFSSAAVTVRRVVPKDLDLCDEYYGSVSVPAVAWNDKVVTLQVRSSGAGDIQQRQWV